MGTAARIKSIDVSTITSIDLTLETLQILDAQLPNSQLRQATTFNTAYQIVTKTIKTARDNNYFHNPAFVEELSVCFASYYFQAINEALQESQSLAPAWQLLMQPDNNKPQPVFILLLLGANAHINYDLPLALSNVLKPGNTRELLKDVIKIDRLLLKSGREILESFDEPKPGANFIKRRCSFLYFRPIMLMISFWRIIAWRNYRRIQKQYQVTSRLNRHSTRIARRLLLLGRYLS
jgi:hypothetical protein